MKRFYNGLIFGVGVGVAMAVVLTTYFWFILPKALDIAMKETVLDSPAPVTGEIVKTPPEIEKKERFLGSKNITSGDYRWERKTLAEGPGKIVGKAMWYEKPVEGLKLRLALNGSAMSAWATTKNDGSYTIDVPYGTYEINGFRFDDASADRALAGKIHHPRRETSSGVFEVSETETGRGLEFSFLDPITKYLPKKQYSLSDEIVLKWSAHPDAYEYDVQLFEKSDDHYMTAIRSVFNWETMPKTQSNTLNLEKYKNDYLKPNHFYLFEVTAYDQDRRIVSQTVDYFSRVDFEIIEQQQGD